MKHYPEHFKRLFGLAGVLALVYACVSLYITKDISGVELLTHFIPLVAISMLYGSGLLYDPIDFDANFFYTKNRLNKIHLSSIQAIKLTWKSDLKHNRYWEITYFSEKVESISLIPSTMEDSFAKLIEAVKQANPSVDADIFEFKMYFGFIPGVSWRPNKNKPE